VLRVAGTYNLKRETPRPVKALTPVAELTNTKFLKLLDEATIRSGVTVSTAPNFFADMDSNLTEEFSGPPTTMKAVLSACAQMRYIVKERANITEPEWYTGLGVARFVADGKVWVHRISEGHPGYDYDATERKVQQQIDKGIKPTSCLKLAEVCGEERCEGCIFAGRVKNPLMAARFKDEAPAPVLLTQLGAATVTVSIPAPPKPYTRMADGGIAMVTKNKDGDEMYITIYDTDLYPARRLVNTSAGSEQQVWVHIPTRGPQREFTLDADALYDRRKFVVAISNQGIYPKTANLQNLQDYMIAYISELQRLADAEAQCTHLGWADKRTKFILPDKILLDDGTVKPASLSLGAQRSSAQVTKAGTLERQIELMKFYNHPDYLVHQFYILCALAAPFIVATGHHGVVVNATGEPGASKSTALYTGASFWGQPELYPINGTNNGATVRGRNERVTTLANLPICVDEITHMPIKDAIDLAMSISQPGARIRLTSEGVERSAVDSDKATIMLTTANASLHSMLSTDNAAGTAGSMRVVELQFKRTHVHTKAQADDYLHDLKENFGHVGELVMAHAMPQLKAVFHAIREEIRRIDAACDIQPSERFWTAAAGPALAIGEIAVKLGLLPFDIEVIRQWFTGRQVPEMRGVVTDEYTTPITALADYLEHINNNIVVLQKSVSYNGSDLLVTRQPHGELLARYEPHDKLMWVSLKGFKDWCVRQGLNQRKVMEDLSVAKDGQRVIVSSNIKKVLGANSDLAKAQSRVFLINMGHPDICGMLPDLTVVENTKSNLKVVR
jgi:hypothetical protein